jgi:hypothetical protein
VQRLLADWTDALRIEVRVEALTSSTAPSTATTTTTTTTTGGATSYTTSTNTEEAGDAAGGAEKRNGGESDNFGDRFECAERLLSAIPGLVLTAEATRLLGRVRDAGADAGNNHKSKHHGRADEKARFSGAAPDQEAVNQFVESYCAPLLSPPSPRPPPPAAAAAAAAAEQQAADGATAGGFGGFSAPDSTHWLLTPASEVEQEPLKFFRAHDRGGARWGWGGIGNPT